MKKVINFKLGLALLFLVACTSETKNPMTESNDNDVSDSVSKEKIASVKNYLAPPDSNYTGDYFQKYPNGVIKLRGFFRQGKKSGKWMYFHPNGNLWSEAFFDNDLMNGESKVYHSNGKLYYEGAYRSDKPKGLWKFYDSTGAMVTTRNYDSIPGLK